jgi:hypothetical protein
MRRHATAENASPAATAVKTGLVRIIRHDAGPRVYVSGLRVHHGLTGAVMLTCGLLARANARTLLCGMAVSLMVHDAHDFPWSLRDAPATAA